MNKELQARIVELENVEIPEPEPPQVLEIQVPTEVSCCLATRKENGL